VKKEKAAVKTVSITQLPEEPLHLSVSFEEAIKMAVNTPY